LEEEIKELRRQERELKERTKLVKEQLQSVTKYSQYLADIVDARPDEYTEVSEILNRHTTLEQANNVRQGCAVLCCAPLRCGWLLSSHQTVCCGWICCVGGAAAVQDLAKQSDYNNNTIEKTRLELVQLRQDQQNKILVMNGQVQSSQKLIESLRAESATVR